LVSAYRLSFLCCPPSFPLAGGGVQRIVDSRFDSVELGTLAGRYETLPCSKLSLSPPSLFPYLFFVLFSRSPLGKPCTSFPIHNCQRRRRFFSLSMGNGSTRLDSPLWPVLHKRGRTAMAHHITGPWMLPAGVRWGFFPLNRSGGGRHSSPITHAINRWRQTGPLNCLSGCPLSAFTSLPVCLPPSSLFQCLAHGSRRPHLPIFSQFSTPKHSIEWDIHSMSSLERQALTRNSSSRMSSACAFG
jgi:hypothetical protein